MAAARRFPIKAAFRVSSECSISSTLVFPSYDGNGMYLSMGNISGNPEIGMLFIDFEKPFRLRAQGRAEVIVSGPELEGFKDAEMAVKVTIHETWMNCPRYVHRFQKIETSRYAPGVEGGNAILRMEAHRCAARRRASRGADQSRRAIGTTTIDEWMGKVMTGDKGA